MLPAHVHAANSEVERSGGTRKQVALRVALASEGVQPAGQAVAARGRERIAVVAVSTRASMRILQRAYKARSFYIFDFDGATMVVVTLFERGCRVGLHVCHMFAGGVAEANEALRSSICILSVLSWHCFCVNGFGTVRSQQRRIHKLLACNKLSLQLAGCIDKVFACNKVLACDKVCNQLVADSICYKQATCEFGAVVTSLQARHRYKHADFPGRCQLH